MRRLALVVMFGLIAGCDSSHTPARSATTAPDRAVLSPATVAPKAAECSKQLQFGADGTAGPVTCSGGRINVLAWTYYAKGDPLVLTIGPTASPEQVLRSMCSDERHSSKPIVLDTYELASRYYGWSFAIDPAQEFESDNC
jgi:hypothetical protein